LSNLIIGLSLLAVWHFMYEAIIAPTLRLGLRNRLFALRDELRKAKIEGISLKDEDAFYFVHEGVNNFINRLPSLTVILAVKLNREYQVNQKLRTVMDGHLKAVQTAKNETIKCVFEKTNDVVVKAFWVNTGGWLIYIVPIVVVLYFMKRITQVISELLVTPSREMERLIPQEKIRFT